MGTSSVASQEINEEIVDVLTQAQDYFGATEEPHQAQAQMKKLTKLAGPTNRPRPQSTTTSRSRTPSPEPGDPAPKAEAPVHVLNPEVRRPSPVPAPLEEPLVPHHLSLLIDDMESLSQPAPATAEPPPKIPQPWTIDVDDPEAPTFNISVFKVPSTGAWVGVGRESGALAHAVSFRHGAK